MIFLTKGNKVIHMATNVYGDCSSAAAIGEPSLHILTKNMFPDNQVKSIVVTVYKTPSLLSGIFAKTLPF